MGRLYKVLICEDNKNFAKTLKNTIEWLFGTQKTEIQIAISVKEARIFFAKNNFDLITCDGKLIDDNTIDFVGEIIKAGFSKDRIVALVGSDEIKDALELLLKPEDTGNCHCYLKGDFNSDVTADLKKMIENILIN